MKTEELVQQMRAAAEKATKVAPAEWGIDTERQDGAPGRYDEFAMFDNLGRRMFGTENSDANFGEIRDDFDYDGGSAWNEPSRLVMKHVETAQPDNVLALIAALEAANARADAAELARDIAVKEMSAQAMARGEAEGRLRMSETAGVLEGWRDVVIEIR